MALHDLSAAIWFVPALLVLVVAVLLWAAFRARVRSSRRDSRHKARYQTIATILPNTRMDRGSPRAVVNEKAARWQTLTLRERQVAELAAAGKQNVEIAQALHLSPSTISSHLKNIYRKLDIHSRRELANHLQALGHEAER
ncbi:MAG: helix-turn-helix transcriptional regulator [Chloroflexi bacterium]|nr:helix-turn-helix transcriptional regulator [Chloroflexota bacterium]